MLRRLPGTGAMALAPRGIRVDVSVLQHSVPQHIGGQALSLEQSTRFSLLRAAQGPQLEDVNANLTITVNVQNPEFSAGPDTKNRRKGAGTNMSRSEQEDDWIDEVQHREGFVLDEVSLPRHSPACLLARPRVRASSRAVAAANARAQVAHSWRVK
ncbi:hypothetical protein ON010_g11966 [Phytophthora cinnamomi]|nr:hypothetical protein ON010_g11966 [Phytophthora cinnamomi]